MTTCSANRRALLREARCLQRYACGSEAPRYALRRYVRLLGETAPVPVPRWALVPWLTACVEPLPLLPKSASAREFERRLFLVILVTELTPWGAAQSYAAARRSFLAIVARAIGFALLELLVLPWRIVSHGFIWRRGEPA